MKTRLIQLSLVVLLLASCSGSLVAEYRVPPVLSEGTSYGFVVPMGGKIEVKVLEIDKSSGWVKVESEDRMLKREKQGVRSRIANFLLFLYTSFHGKRKGGATLFWSRCLRYSGLERPH